MAVEESMTVATTVTIAVVVVRCHGWLSRARDVDDVSRVMVDCAQHGRYLPRGGSNRRGAISRNIVFG